MKQQLANGILVCIFLIFMGCASLNIPNMTSSGVASLEEDEKRLWKRCEEEQEAIARSGTILQDPELSNYLSEILNNLIPGNIKQQWGIKGKVFVIKNSLFNAFAYPNGVIYIHTGVLANLENEAQLATILAHEITHTLNRHSLKQLRGNINSSAFWTTLIVTAVSVTGESAYADLGRIGYMSAITGYSRSLEKEADTEGFKLLLDNGYDIQETKKAFEIFEAIIKDEKIKGPFFFSTHPRIKNRIANFKKLIKKENKNPTTDSLKFKNNEYRYMNIIKKNILKNVKLDIKISHFKTAERQLKRYLKLEPKSSQAYYLYGELLLNQNKLADAKEKYLLAIENKPVYPDAYKAFGIMAFKEKRINKAKEHFTKYLNRKPNADDKDYILYLLKKIEKQEKKQ